MFSILWEIEVGEPYSLTRKNDIFSGLGERDGGKKPQKADDEKKPSGNAEEEFVRVEEILDTIEEEEESGEGEEKKPSGVSAEEEKKTHEAKLAEEAELLAQELKRAECIVETFRDVKVAPFS